MSFRLIFQSFQRVMGASGYTDIIGGTATENYAGQYSHRIISASYGTVHCH